MIRKVLLTAAAIVALMSAASADHVVKDGFAPYYTSIDEALAAVGDNQMVVVDFYSNT
ncbi:MAG: hypothetical protein KKA42_12680 [candidate division Zixibacteria bacterium]|nr:hypothetical protein [candidate division Zixibacteria bacterium]